MKKAKIKMTLKEIIFLFIIINMLLNRVLYIHILINSEYLCFNIMTKKTVKWNKLEWFSVLSQQVIDVIGKSDIINKIAKIHINIDEYTEIC